MSKDPLPTRRSLVVASAAAGVLSLLPNHLVEAGEKDLQLSSRKGDIKMASKDEIRPFSYHASEDELADLRKRINATKWPDREQVADDSQGVQLETVKKLARYWATEHDWRKVEASTRCFATRPAFPSPSPTIRSPASRSAPAARSRKSSSAASSRPPRE